MPIKELIKGLFQCGALWSYLRSMRNKALALPPVHIADSRAYLEKVSPCPQHIRAHAAPLPEQSLI